MRSKPRLFPTIFLQRPFLGVILGSFWGQFYRYIPEFPQCRSVIKNPQTVGITWFFRISWDEQILPVKVSSRLVRMRSLIRIRAAAPEPSRPIRGGCFLFCCILFLYSGNWPPAQRLGADTCPAVIVEILRAYVAAVTPADKPVPEEQGSVQNLAGIRRICRVKPQLLQA